MYEFFNLRDYRYHLRAAGKPFHVRDGCQKKHHIQW